MGKGKVNFYSIIKRLCDLAISIVAIIFIPFITIFVKLAFLLTGDYQPIFYTQTRIGQHGKPFQLIKFRTMLCGADEDILEKLLEDPEIRAEWETNHKLKNDPRITRIGKILRKTSIDEVPQFINIFLGQMSLIGPRPYMINEKPYMKSYYKYIVRTKPGLTGLWQVSGRSTIDFNNRLILEKQYSNNISFSTDFKILVKTFNSVLSHEGAE